MSRNFYQPKDFQIERKDGRITVFDCGDVLFSCFDDGADEVALHAYFKGLNDGKKAGRALLQHELLTLLGAARSDHSHQES